MTRSKNRIQTYQLSWPNLHDMSYQSVTQSKDYLQSSIKMELESLSMIYAYIIIV